MDKAFTQAENIEMSTQQNKTETESFLKPFAKHPALGFEEESKNEDSER